MNIQFIDAISFCVPKAFSVPKRPTYTSGLLVIESDDGRVSDYTHWYPLMQKLSMEYSDFYPNNVARFCPAINTSVIGEEGRMSVSQLQELSRWTEIMAHGRQHIRLGRYPVPEGANAGSKKFMVRNSARLITNTTTYEIIEGSKREQIRVLTADEDGIGWVAGEIEVETPLNNSYTSSAYVQLSQEGADEELGGCLSDLKDWGISAESFVYPGHEGATDFGNPDALSWVENYFSSGRGRLVSSSNDPINTSDTPLNNLKAIYSTSYTQQDIEHIMDEVQAKNGVLIWYGHGEPSSDMMVFLEKLIRTAFAKGVRIATRREAVRFLKLQQ